MTFQITALYASVLGLMMIWLSLAVSIKRGKTGISILHGDNMELALTMRRHGNFAENVPMGLILLGLLEAHAASILWLHACGGLLLLSRVLHPFGLTVDNPKLPLRAIAGTLGHISNLVAIAYLLWTRFA